MTAVLIARERGEREAGVGDRTNAAAVIEQVEEVAGSFSSAVVVLASALVGVQIKAMERMGEGWSADVLVSVETGPAAGVIVT